MTRTIWRQSWIPPISGLFGAMTLVGGVVATGSNETHKSQSFIMVMVTATEQRCSVAKQVPAVVAIVNMSDRPVYVPKLVSPYVRVTDEEGRLVEADPIPEPGPPPVEYYMQNGQEKVLMEPVWRLEAKGGVVTVLPDALDLYHKHLKKGRYLLTIPMDSIPLFKEASVVLRTNNVTHGMWVRADAPREKVPIVQRSSTLEIE
ncbi:MAG: hypothetical protein WCS01_11480 [bacterium]